MSSVAIAISLVACQPKTTEEKPQEQTAASEVQDNAQKFIGNVENLKLNLPTCKNKDCPELKISRIQSNQVFIDHVIDEQILKNLADVLAISPKLDVNEQSTSTVQATSEAYLESLPSATQKLERQVAPYTQEFLNLDKEVKALGANHKISLVIQPVILSSEGSIVTIVLNSTNYLGGAHGSTSQQYFHFDLDNKKQLKLKDIVEPNQMKALDEKAYAAFKQWVIDSEISNNVDEYEQVWKYSLSHNFNLGKNGLNLQYGEYEIGPYVVGLPRLTIPYDQLQGILKPQYLPLAPTQDQVASEAQVTKDGQK